MLEGRALARAPVGWGWGCGTLGWLHPQGWLFFKELLVRGLLPCCFGGLCLMSKLHPSPQDLFEREVKGRAREEPAAV